ncbi:cytochrome P450 [Hysterangium stoloniferum]|nr:cytochrome P450 [Hysterangium stoloniferum]
MSSKLILSSIIVGVSFLVFATYRRWSRIPKGLSLPPGPPRRLIVGNLCDMPKQHAWKTYKQWAKTYGDLVYINLLGTSMVFVNSPEMAHELFEKRSSIYSDRHNAVMLCELMKFDWAVPTMRYGHWWRRHRQIIQQKFNASACLDYFPVQLKYSRKRLCDSPELYVEHVRHVTGAMILEITYGIQVRPKRDPYLTLVEEGIAATCEAAAPGAFLVNVLPILKYVPEWVPGAGFQTKARLWRKLMTDMVEVPFKAVKESIEAGSVAPSMASSLLEELSRNQVRFPDDEKIIRNVAGVVYAAGADTSACTLEVFFLAMTRFQHAQEMAQRELDEVIGSDRLPTSEDRDRLPYINALIKELLRWHPVTPLAIPHRLNRDDIVGNYFIPAGTVVWGNSRCQYYRIHFSEEILHSEATYGPDAATFEPERFLRSGVRDPDPAFGFGRRLCPGRYMADNTLYIMIASILHVFRIAPIQGPSGPELPDEDAFTPGIVARPLPFQCSITPRSTLAKILIDQEMDVYNSPCQSL